ncbi:Zona pellucida sperm-binding protein 3 [Liparis tanakae]|uniref:Zona pellucida sperm-binding protein 3 n=1 Tax=Liparis tanakae TaxID=230148 RepID=A0A4Z2EIQ4_9TELE|nr:Zona pellucida sperm-binding protein 3 [Liparis tanakae]
MKTFPPVLLFMLQLTLPTLPASEALTRTSNVSRRDTGSLPVRSTGPEPVLDALPPARAAAGPPGRSAVSVRTSCELNKMRVQVHRSVLGTGQPDSRLTLGTCGASRATRDYVYFDYDVSMCGTRRAMVDNQVAYLNELHYDPLRLQGPIRRAVPFRLSVACHYNRFQYSDYTPKLRESAAPMKTRTKLVLTPRNAQWDSLPPSGQYSLGRSMYFQAEAPPLLREERLYVHRCYATPENSHSSTPQVPVVENSG